MKLSVLILLSLYCFINFLDIQACTTAIITGKATPDGRPILWKHRDASDYQNKLMFFKDGKYEYIGLVNTGDKAGDEVWAGCNSAGFAIMNSASYNLAANDTTKAKDREGIVMKLALKTCESVADFEKMLTDLPKPLGVEANFGVIDAKGGAAYFETGNYLFTKIDANDPTVAPFGYLIRTNYSFTGPIDDGYGYIRYSTAENLFDQARAMGNLTSEFILQDVSRSFRHSLLQTDLEEIANHCHENQIKFVHFEDFIPRFSSTAAFLVQGVKPGESPDFCTIWTILGFPLCSVAVPTWISGGENLPPILMAGQANAAPLCDFALTLKDRCFPIKRGSGSKYLNLAALFNQEKTGIMQKLAPVECEILDNTAEKLKSWRQTGMRKSEIQVLYLEIDKLIKKQYVELFGMK
jgi:hypothetical protein